MRCFTDSIPLRMDKDSGNRSLSVNSAHANLAKECEPLLYRKDTILCKEKRELFLNTEPPANTL
jgi:hypothetical protein